MNIHQVIAKIKNNEFNILTGKHSFRSEYVLENLLRSLEFHASYHTDKIKEEGIDMSDTDNYHVKVLNHINSDDAYGPDAKFMDGFDTEVHCSRCGKRGLRLWIKDENTLMVSHWKEKGTLVQCPIEDGSHKTIIDVPTGVLQFANWFDIGDAPEDKEHSEEYDLCTLLGRRNIADYLAEKGFGYGQMGNMSVYIYIAKDKKSIKILSSDYDWIEDEIHYLKSQGEDIPANLQKIIAEKEEFEANYDFIGSLSLGVWRWMCADVTNIGDIRKSDEILEPVNVCSGKWEVIHHYDCEDAFVASEMKFVEA